MNGLSKKSIEKAEVMASFKILYQNNREKQKETYPDIFKQQGYNFYLKLPGKKYYNESKEIQRFCFEKWKEGKKYREIADMLGLKSYTTVCYHIKNYTKK